MKQASNIGVWTWALLISFGAQCAQAETDPCAEVRTAMESSLPSSVPTENTIQLLSISPTSTSKVQKATVMVADLAYAVKNFALDQYFVSVMFTTTDTGSFKPNRAHVPLTRASGTVRVCYPLAELWDRPELEWPLEVSFHLHMMRDDEQSITLTGTPFTFYLSDEAPQAALARQKENVEHRQFTMQLAQMYFTFLSVDDVHKRCMQDVEDTQVRESMAQTADKWTAGHRAIGAELGEMHFLAVLREFNGDRYLATQATDEVYEKASGYWRQVVADMPLSDLTERCRQMAAGLAESEVEALFAGPLAHFREYAATHEFMRAKP